MTELILEAVQLLTTPCITGPHHRGSCSAQFTNNRIYTMTQNIFTYKAVHEANPCLLLLQNYMY